MGVGFTGECVGSMRRLHAAHPNYRMAAICELSILRFPIPVAPNSGRQFTQSHLDQGPEVWRVKVERTAK